MTQSEDTKLNAVFSAIEEDLRINSGISTIQKVDLSGCNLTEIPTKIFELSASLTELNLGNNNLSDLPDKMASLTNLRILFFANNQFRTFPSILGKMRSLFMISFKSNKLESIPDEALRSTIHWLILTDNKLKGKFHGRNVLLFY